MNLQLSSGDDLIPISGTFKHSPLLVIICKQMMYTMDTWNDYSIIFSARVHGSTETFLPLYWYRDTSFFLDLPQYVLILFCSIMCVDAIFNKYVAFIEVIILHMHACIQQLGSGEC